MYNTVLGNKHTQIHEKLHFLAGDRSVQVLALINNKRPYSSATALASASTLPSQWLMQLYLLSILHAAFNIPQNTGNMSTTYW